MKSTQLSQYFLLEDIDNIYLNITLVQTDHVSPQREVCLPLLLLLPQTLLYSYDCYV